MSYSTEIAALLTAQLSKFVTANRHQLAGQLANLDFWLAETSHCLAVVDDYEARFRRLKTAQTEYVRAHDTIEFDPRDPCCTAAMADPPQRVPSSELRDTRRALCEAAYRFLVRSFNEGLITEPKLRDACGRLGISVATIDLKGR